MEVCKVTLTFESVDEILRCDNSNESSLPALPHSAICFSKLYTMKFANLLEICLWLHLTVKGLSHCTCIILRTCSFAITTTYRLWLINEVNDRLSTSTPVSSIHLSRKMAFGITSIIKFVHAIVILWNYSLVKNTECSLKLLKGFYIYNHSIRHGETTLGELFQKLFAYSKTTPMVTK